MRGVPVLLYTVPSLACWEQNSRLIDLAAPKDGELVQPGSPSFSHRISGAWCTITARRCLRHGAFELKLTVLSASKCRGVTHLKVRHITLPPHPSETVAEALIPREWPLVAYVAYINNGLGSM